MHAATKTVAYATARKALARPIAEKVAARMTKAKKVVARPVKDRKVTARTMCTQVATRTAKSHRV